MGPLSRGYGTCFNHIASQQNLEIWLLGSGQRYWSNFVLPGRCVYNWKLKATKWVPTAVYAYNILYVKFSYSYVQSMPQPHSQSTELKNMITSIKTKVPIKYGRSGMLCVELRTKKLWKMYQLPWMHACTWEILILTCTEHASTTSYDIMLSLWAGYFKAGSVSLLPADRATTWRLTDGTHHHRSIQVLAVTFPAWTVTNTPFE